MNAHIIKIGNSKGIRIPKPLLDESGLDVEVEITAKAGEITIVPAKKPRNVSETMLLSEKVLAKDWLRPEEDKAWINL